MLIKYARYSLLVFCLLVTAMPAPAIAEDYKLTKQNKLFYQHLYAWYVQDKHNFQYCKSEFNRYSLLLLQEHWKPTNKEWLEEKVSIIQNVSWKEDRKGKGLFIPRENVTVYLNVLLEKEGLKAFQEHIVGQPLRYDNSSVIHYLRSTSSIDGGK